MVAAPNEVAAVKGEPDTLDLYRRPSATILVLVSAFAIRVDFTSVSLSMKKLAKVQPLYIQLKGIYGAHCGLHQTGY